MAELLKRSQAVHAFLRLCDKKDLKQLFTRRGREGKHLRLQMLESATASRGGRKMWRPWVYENVSVMHNPDHSLYLSRISQAFWSQMLQVPNEINFPHLPLHHGPRFLPLLGPLWEKGAAGDGWQWWLLQAIAPSQLQAARARIKLLQTVGHAWAMHHLGLDSFIYFLIKRADVVSCSELTVAVLRLKIDVLFVLLFGLSLHCFPFVLQLAPAVSWEMTSYYSIETGLVASVGGVRWSLPRPQGLSS